MNNSVYWLVFVIAFLALVLLSGTDKTSAKTVDVCVSLKLPKPGKCTYLTVRGYKVRVCR